MHCCRHRAPAERQQQESAYVEVLLTVGTRDKHSDEDELYCDKRL